MPISRNTPQGDLLVACHTGKPDWGTGPQGKGKLFKISWVDKHAPQPVLAYAAAAVRGTLGQAGLLFRYKHYEALAEAVDVLVRDAALRQRLIELTAKQRIPAIYYDREYVAGGGLISYGASLPAQFRRAATYVDKILKGAKPADLPVEQPMKFEMVINLKTAQALGLIIPPSVLFQADEVIK